MLYRFHQVIFVLFVAIVIGTILRPVVAWLHRRGSSAESGGHSYLSPLLTLLTGLQCCCYFPLITEQSATITAAVPGYYQNLREWLVGHPNPMLDGLNALLPATLSFPDPVQQTGQELLDSAEQVLGYVASAASGIFTAVATSPLGLLLDS
ncbi:MAG: AI-2E family transporter [Chloroflexi bacterium]|nr:AI-2E family transporter [Chloroflexota bacterium]